jgi:hypothetical protein
MSANIADIPAVPIARTFIVFVTMFFFFQARRSFLRARRFSSLPSHLMVGIPLSNKG